MKKLLPILTLALLCLTNISAFATDSENYVEQICNLMGDTRYCHDFWGGKHTIFAEDNTIYQQNEYDEYDVETLSDGDITYDSENNIYTIKYDSNKTFEFIVDNTGEATISRIEINYYGYYDFTALPEASEVESAIMSAMDNAVYYGPDSKKIYIGNYHIVYSDNGDSYIYQSGSFASGTGCYTCTSGDETFTFLVNEHTNRIESITYNDETYQPKVGRINKNYYYDAETLVNALNEVDGNATFTAYFDIYTDQTITVNAGAQVSFSTTNHTFTCNDIVVEGSLTTYGDSDASTIINTKESIVVNNDTASLTIYNGTFRSESNIIKASNGTLNVNGGTFYASASQPCFLIGNADITLNGGNFLTAEGASSFQLFAYNTNSEGSIAIGEEYAYRDNTKANSDVTEITDVITYPGHIIYTVFQNLVDMIGNGIYDCVDYDTEHVMAEGEDIIYEYIDCEYTYEKSFSNDFEMSYSDNTYTFNSDYYTFTFIIEDGKIASITQDYTRSSTSYELREGTGIEETPTAVSKGQVIKPKAVKVLRNGQILIIVDGQAYTLSGARK